jgi:hypothetical protein
LKIAAEAFHATLVAAWALVATRTACGAFNASLLLPPIDSVIR